jgi:hypothetical protein
MSRRECYSVVNFAESTSPSTLLARTKQSGCAIPRERTSRGLRGPLVRNVSASSGSRAACTGVSTQATRCSNSRLKVCEGIFRVMGESRSAGLNPIVLTGELMVETANRFVEDAVRERLAVSSQPRSGIGRRALRSPATHPSTGSCRAMQMASLARGHLLEQSVADSSQVTSCAWWFSCAL